MEKNLGHGDLGTGTTNPPPYNYVPPGNFAPISPQPGLYPNAIQHGQQSGDYPRPQSPPTVQVIQVGSYNLRGESTRITCPKCKADVSTRVRYESGRMTHIIALVLCLVGCWPCCLIPYCADGCMDAQHECPNCNHFIGIYRR